MASPARHQAGNTAQVTTLGPAAFACLALWFFFFFFVIFLEETLPGGGGGGLPEVTKPGQALRKRQGKSVSGSECTMGCPGLCG